MDAAVTSEDFTSLNIYQKLAKITGEVGAIKKGGMNKEQGYGFIEYAAVAGELRGLFAKYGVVIVPRMQQGSKQSRSQVTSARGAVGNYLLVDMYFTIVNADNPEDKFNVQWTGEALDYGDKATNKAATSALKYYLMRQFNISEKGEDPDSESVELGPIKSSESTIEVLSRAKVKINEVLEAHGHTLDLQKLVFITGVLGQSKIDSLDQADAVMDALEQENA